VVQPPLDVSVTLRCVLPARAPLLMTAGIAAGSSRQKSLNRFGARTV